MKKADAEREVTYLATKWAREVWKPANPESDPSSISFLVWLRENHYPVTCFKTIVGDPNYFITMWFDRATGQSWKN